MGKLSDRDVGDKTIAVMRENICVKAIYHCNLYVIGPILRNELSVSSSRMPLDEIESLVLCIQSRAAPPDSLPRYRNRVP